MQFNLQLSTGDTPSNLVLRWASETFSHLLELYNSSAGHTAGAQLISGYHLWQVCKHAMFCKPGCFCQAGQEYVDTVSAFC